MTTIAFTGPHKNLKQGWTKLSTVIPTLEADCFVSGCAYGVDTLAAKYAHQSFPDAKHLLVVPAPHLWHNKDLISYFQVNRLDVEFMPAGTDYMDRNQRMVDLATRLAAFPFTSVEALRSGTWATIRRARRKGIPVDIYPLNER